MNQQQSLNRDSSSKRGLTDNNNYIKNILHHYQIPSVGSPVTEVLDRVSDSKMYIQSETEDSEDNHNPRRKEEDYEDGVYDDSGHEDEEDDLGVSEEIILPEEEDESEENEEEGAMGEETDEEDRIFKRQLSYPPMPDYIPPGLWPLSVGKPPPESDNYTANSSKDDMEKNPPTSQATGRRPSHPHDRLGVLTPMEEVTEPPSSAGTEASFAAHRYRAKRGAHPYNATGQDGSPNAGDSDNNDKIERQKEAAGANQKSILKSKSPTDSPERRVKFIGAGSLTPSERTVSPTEFLESSTSEYSSLVESGRKTEVQMSESQAIPEETEVEDEDDVEEDEDEEGEGDEQEQIVHETSSGNGESKGKVEERDDVIERLEKVATWQMGNVDLSAGNLEPDENQQMSSMDTEFASILDDIIAELHSWDRLAGTGAGITEINASRQDHLANVSSQLASQLSQVGHQTIMTNLPQLIPLITTLLCLTEMNFRAQLTTLNTVNVFVDRLRDCKTRTGLKVLPNADLTWLIRILCDISSESSRSVLKSEGTAALTRLVKVAGPEMIVEPILFILMGNDEKALSKKKLKGREGSGNIVPAGVPGGAPKIKATALDTLTFALLTFPRDDFELDVVAKLACHCLLHQKRRVRQAALECLAVISHAIGPNIALPMIRQFISEEEEELLNPKTVPDHVNASNSSISSSDASATVSGKATGSATSSNTSSATESAQESNSSRVSGSPSKIPVPISKLPPSQPAEQPGGSQEVPNNGTPQNSASKSQSSSAVPGQRQNGPTPSSAVSARVSRHVLPTPSSEELVEYGVKIPAKCQLVNRQAVRIGSQRDLLASCSESESNKSGTASSGTERLSSSGESYSSISNIDYNGLMELEPVLSSKGSGTGQRRKASSTHLGSEMDLRLAPDVAWILNGTGPVKKCDPVNVLSKEPPSGSARGVGQQWNSSLTNSSGSESEMNNSDLGKRRPTGSNRDSKMNRSINSSSRTDSLQETKDPTLSRYAYYPSATTPHMSSQRSLTSSDSLNSRLSSKTSYNLLPNKYSIINRPNNNVHPSMYGPPYSGPSDYLSHHSANTLLPGAYEHPHGPSGDSYSTWTTTSHPEFGHLSRVKPKPLQPIQSLRDKFFDSSRANGGHIGTSNGSTSNGDGDSNRKDSFRSDSRSGSTEDDEEDEDNESEYEKSDETNGRNDGKSQQQGSSNIKQSNGRTNDGAKGDEEKHFQLIEKAQEQLIMKSLNKVDKQVIHELQSKRDEVAAGVNREFQVYHHRIEVEPSATAALVASINKKRGEADSAGSNHTRDSGVSLGSSVPGSKTPPFVHTTPPAIHLAPEDNSSRNGATTDSGQRLARSKQAIRNENLRRNWQSTPDVPQASDSDELHLSDNGRYESSRRDISGSPSHSDNRLQSNQIAATQSPSDFNMLLHKKPVLARRGQSVGRLPKSPRDSSNDRLPMPNLRYPTNNLSSDHSRSNLKNGSGDHQLNKKNSLLDLDQDEDYYKNNGSSDKIVGFTFAADGSISPVHRSKPIRQSASTGNLIENQQDDRYHQGSGSRLSSHTKLKSKSTYLQVVEDDILEPQPNESARSRGRVSRRDGPFGEVRAQPEDFRSSPTPPESRNNGIVAPNTFPRRNVTNGTSKSVNGRIGGPPKVFKGSYREINSRKPLNGSITNEVFPRDLKPVTSPRHALPQALVQLQSTEWETNVDGFRQIVRLIRFNPETIRADLHSVNIMGIKHVANLRSQVCRAAILCVKELFDTMGKSMEHDCEKIAEKLLDKAADTNKFIREDSGKALEAMMNNLTPTKWITCLDLFGTRHRNPAVRCMAAKMTAKLVQTIGPDRCLAELPERLLPMLCRFLQEGSLETRKTAKEALSALMIQPSFNALLKRCVPSDVLRHAQKSIDSLYKEIQTEPNLRY